MLERDDEQKSNQRTRTRVALSGRVLGAPQNLHPLTRPRLQPQPSGSRRGGTARAGGARPGDRRVWRWRAVLGRCQGPPEMCWGWSPRRSRNFENFWKMWRFFQLELEWLGPQSGYLHPAKPKLVKGSVMKVSWHFPYHQAVPAQGSARGKFGVPPPLPPPLHLNLSFHCLFLNAVLKRIF